MASKQNTLRVPKSTSFTSKFQCLGVRKLENLSVGFLEMSFVCLMERNPNWGKLQATEKPSSCSFMVDTLVFGLYIFLIFFLCGKQTLLSHVPGVPTMPQAAERNFTDTHSSYQMSRVFSAVLNMLPTLLSTPQLSSYPADARAVRKMKKHLV